MSAVHDDMVSRPGSAVSLLRTVVGLYMRDAGGWLPTAVLMGALATLEVPAAQARTAISRVKQRGLLVAEQHDGGPGFALAPGAAAMLSRGDGRIRQPRSMSAGDPWCLISFSIPESERGRRHQLRRQLQWIGCGTVDPGLWICPDFLRPDVEQILADLDLREQAVLFTTSQPHPGVPLRELVASWWDLPALAQLHTDFLEQNTAVAGAAVGPSAETFAQFVRCLDTWRPIPYLDPGLPADVLPAGWPGASSAGLFLALRESHAEPAATYFRQLSAMVAGAGHAPANQSFVRN
ncbi:PaaX family transcriptional regulator C-terminal domain-containing protein [Pseudarthrobacter sp. PS3-L1]|uniref:PaaX family transcriptional regulator n=1 Tax=Pseudarthrobacter sp. PS3-L1 TaxID=3046207 RepID=UPI0024BA6CE5|nr:PaaX family transcriptional regulator C-terminal domain-containing protein [Pseudarthrobacter sp. PS3-L1]MDJ0319310.1 PaaX family transcriptional regulator C-terminal domain-containing protein [Pseudarthrobacter sp. PS3-L1]